MQTASPIDTRLAERYFREAKEIAADDAGTLWGVSLDGPIVFVDPDSRAFVANNRPSRISRRTV